MRYDDDLRGIRPMRLALYRDLLDIQRNVPALKVRRLPFGTDPEPDLRERLFRAAAAWLIGWATILAALHWGL
jgi:hypothetical protein